MDNCCKRFLLLRRVVWVPPVKHDGAQKLKVGGGQWPPVHGDDVRSVAAVGIVDANNLIIGGGGNSDKDADQTRIEEQAYAWSRFSR